MGKLFIGLMDVIMLLDLHPHTPPQKMLVAHHNNFAPGDWKQVLGRAWGAPCNTFEGFEVVQQPLLRRP